MKQGLDRGKIPVQNFLVFRKETMNTKEILKGVANMWSKHPDRFVRGHRCCTVNNTDTPVGGKRSYKFCSVGVVDQAKAEGLINSKTQEAVFDKLNAAARALYGSDIVSVNDDRGRMATIACFRKAARS